MCTSSMDEDNLDWTETVAVIVDYGESHPEIRVPRSRFRMISGRFGEEHATGPILHAKSHVSQESLDDFKRFVENGHDELEIKETNFDDLYLLNTEFECHLDEKLTKYANEYFQVDKHHRLLECLCRRVDVNNVTSDLESRFKDALCESHFDISDPFVQECVQKIGLGVFLRIFAQDDYELVRDHFNHVIDFVLWVVDRDDLFGSCGLYLLRGVDARQLTILQLKRIHDIKKFDKSALTHDDFAKDLFEEAYRYTRSIYILLILLLIVFLASFGFVSCCAIEERRHRRVNEELEAQKQNLGARNYDLEGKNMELERNHWELEGKNRDLEEKNRDLEEKNRDLEGKNRELEEKNMELERKTGELEGKNRDLERKNIDLEQNNRGFASDKELEVKSPELETKKNELEEPNTALASTCITQNTHAELRPELALTQDVDGVTVQTPQYSSDNNRYLCSFLVGVFLLGMSGSYAFHVLEKKHRQAQDMRRRVIARYLQISTRTTSHHRSRTSCTEGLSKKAHQRTHTSGHQVGPQQKHVRSSEDHKGCKRSHISHKDVKQIKVWPL